MKFSEHQFVPYEAVRSVGRGPVLVLAPHPDDEVFGCGGAIMRHLEAGDPVRVVIVTDGAFGQDRDRATYALTRQSESRHAGTLLGYGEPDFWELPDRGLEYGEALIRRILDAIEDNRAELLYAPSWWEVHPDHLVLALAAAEAVRRCPRDILLVMYEVGVPLHPSHLVDITPVLERKSAAMACFASQMSQQSYDRHVSALNRFRTYTLPEEIQAAEALRTMRRADLQRDPLRLIRPGDYYTRTNRDTVKQPPLISAILLAEDAQCLADTLDALALQTHPNIEILIVAQTQKIAEGSTDWCGRFPVRTLLADTEEHPAKTLNQALEESRGDYICLIDDRSLPDPDHLNLLLEQLNSDPVGQCVYSGLRIRDDATGQSRIQNERLDRLDLQAGTGLPMPAALFARELVAADCRFDEQLDTLDVWDLTAQIHEHIDPIHLDRATLTWRQPRQTGNRNDPRPWGASPQAYEKWSSRWGGREMLALARRLNGSLDEARLQLTERDDQCAALSVERDRLRSDLDSTDQERQELQARIAAMEAASQRNTAEREALRLALEAIYRSTSWRLTAPLRWMVTRLRRGATPK
ncbi:LmbE family protein [Thiorhodococcus drewsii AZ1]|uniref:LmbE family protein n=1 Tax=Thiorhodococcus drewsii AZ1 TaxID=765913 RepID=G2DVG8_9GAMM|nr:PIG-L family deacetylase [Thiorhodococcus drewsii]EGV33983.1 LmbE family protein [Thiorhodococcus drewsii AZ1]